MIPDEDEEEDDAEADASPAVAEEPPLALAEPPPLALVDASASAEALLPPLPSDDAAALTAASPEAEA